MAGKEEKNTPSQKRDKLTPDVEHSFAEIRDRIRRFDGGMQSHECVDLKQEVYGLLDGLEKELREQYGE